MVDAPDNQVAYDQFIAGVYHPIFFNRLKQAGLSPRTEEEAQQALYLGARLFAEHQASELDELRKQGSLFSHAIAELDGTLGNAPTAGLDRYAKEAALAVLSHPELGPAVSTLTDIIGY